jgi:hypothetical protein
LRRFSDEAHRRKDDAGGNRKFGFFHDLASVMEQIRLHKKTLLTYTLHIRFPTYD